MSRLDGGDLRRALASLAAAADVTPAHLREAMQSHEHRAGGETAEESAEWRIEREVFAQLGVEVDALTFDDAYYFHGTRVLDPTRFSAEGILPLDQVVDDLWDALYNLVATEHSREEWDEFRRSIRSGGGADSGSLYRLKTGDRTHYGPHGTFVREVLLDPKPPAHDYLGNPEIVEDIARCYTARYGSDLEALYNEAATPCIVTFVSARVESGARNSVFWFAYDTLREGGHGMNANGGIALRGEPVRPDQIVAVEICEAVPGVIRRYRPQ